MDKICGTCGHCRNTHDGPYCYKSGYPRPVSPIRVMDCWVDPADVEKEPQATKVCSKCGRELPIANFGRHSRTKDGYQPCCRECLSKQNSGHRKRKPFEHNEAPAKPEEPEQIPEGMKRCCHCGRILPVTEFRKHGKSKDGLQYACKECQVEMTTSAKQKRMKEKKEIIREAQKEAVKAKILAQDPEVIEEVAAPSIPKVVVRREIKLTKSITVQAHLYKVECNGNGKGAFELWTTREEMEKVVMVWNHNPLTVTLAFDEIEEA